MNWLKSGLSRRFAAVMGALALMPVLFLSWRMMEASQRGVQDAVLEMHVKLAEKSAERLEGWVDSVDGRVGVALVALSARMDWADKQNLLKRLVESGAGFASVSLLRRKGGAILDVYNPDIEDSSTALDPEAARASLRRALSVGGRAAEVLKGKSGPLLVLHYPFSKDIFARVVLPMRGIAERVASERVGGTGFAVPSLGGAVLILQLREEAYLAATEARKAAGVAVIVVIVGSLLAAALLARLLTAPVLRLIRAAEAVARGDFLARVEITTGDELQELAETFNAMTERLRQYSVLQVDRLLAEQRKTEAILFSIGEGIVMADREGLVQLANRRAREMFGLPTDADLEGRPFSEALPDGPLRAAVMAAGLKPGQYEEVDLSSEAERRFVRVTASPVVTPGRGAELGTVYALRDVTLERELEKMKEDFLHYITHDLRNPLGSAMGFLDLLLKGTAGVLNPDQHSIVSSVRRSTSRLMNLINNILDIAKMEAGRVRLQLRTASMAGVAGRAIDILEQLARAKNVTLQLAAVEEFSIEIDADMIERVFTNLIGNAIKFTPEGGTVTVSLMADGASVKCCVEDTGEGIPADYISRVFEKFEQVQGQRRGGTGLGLTISRFFVEAHLGRIWAESDPGRGARFYFVIPRGLSLAEDGAVRISETAT